MFAICCSVDVAVSNTFSQLITDELQLLHFDENNHLKCEQAQAQAKNQQKLNKNSTQNSSNNSNVRSGAPIWNQYHAHKNTAKIDEIKRNECLHKIGWNWISERKKIPTLDKNQTVWKLCLVIVHSARHCIDLTPYSFYQMLQLSKLSGNFVNRYTNCGPYFAMNIFASTNSIIPVELFTFFFLIVITFIYL